MPHVKLKCLCSVQEFLKITKLLVRVYFNSERYKNELTKQQKDDLENLVRYQKHYLVTPEILRELRNSRNRDEKEGKILIFTVSPVSFINKTIEEDRWDVPKFPMDED